MSLKETSHNNYSSLSGDKGWQIPVAWNFYTLEFDTQEDTNVKDASSCAEMLRSHDVIKSVLCIAQFSTV